MIVGELIKQFEQRMRPYADLDVDNDCFQAVGGVDLMDALGEAFEGTGVRVNFWWNYDD